MEVLIVILPIAAGIGLIFLAAFFWAWRTGQFEDLDAPARRMIYDKDE